MIEKVDFIDHGLYTRNIQFAKNALNQYSLYLQQLKGISEQEAKEFINVHIKPKIKDPSMTVLKKNSHGDRYVHSTTLMGHVQEAIQESRILVPSMTQYLNEKTVVSPISVYMVKNMNKRKKLKKEMARAAASGDTVRYEFFNSGQTAKKTNNNAVSGAQAVASTGIKNSSAHLTLTSICRITTAIGNTHVERCLAGTRLYFDANTALANIVHLSKTTDLAAFDQVLKQYNIVYPTVEDVMECIIYSLSLYTVNKNSINHIREYVESLNNIQRAAVVYMGDLFHLKKHNPKLLSIMIDELGTVNNHPLPSREDQLSFMFAVGDGILSHAKQIIGVHSVDQDPDIGKWPDENLSILYQSCQSVYLGVVKYKPLLNALFINHHLPPRCGSFPSSVRRSVLGGDTDSTFYTVQDWCQWKNNSITMDENYIKVTSVMVYLVSATLPNYLAYFSAQMGVSKDKLTMIKMKNEYRFDVMLMSLLTKHYAAIIGAKEGNMTSKTKYEVKGVNFITKGIPKMSLSSCEDILKNDIIDSVQKTGKINLKHILKKIALTEAKVVSSVNEANSGVLRRGKINISKSYKHGDKTPAYQQHVLWNEVFGEKYGYSGEPPYSTLAINTTTNTKARMDEFISKIQDKALALRLVSWMDRNNRVKLESYSLPEHIIKAIGVPDELKPVINYHTVVRKACNNHYLLAQSLGVYPDNEQRTVLEWLGVDLQECL